MVLVNGELCHHPLRQLQIGDVISFRDRNLKRRLAYFFMRRLLRFQKFKTSTAAGFFNTRFGKYKGKVYGRNKSFQKNNKWVKNKGKNNKPWKNKYKSDDKVHTKVKKQKNLVRKGNFGDKFQAQSTQKDKGSFKKPVNTFGSSRRFFASTNKKFDDKKRRDDKENKGLNNKKFNDLSNIKKKSSSGYLGKNKYNKAQDSRHFTKNALMAGINTSKRKPKLGKKIKFSSEKLFRKKSPELLKRLNKRRCRNMSPVLLTHLGGLRQYNLIFLPRLLAVQVVDRAYLLKNVYYPNSLDLEVLKVHFKSLS